MDVAPYVATLLKEGAHISSGAAKRLNQAELDAALAEIAQFSRKIPSLPDEAFSRQSLYQDHD